MKTKAAILVEQRKPLVFDEVEIPALKYGQVLVKIKTSRICGSQLGEIDGVKGPDKWLPHLLGHEGGGVILETGPGVRHVQEGDHVVLHWRPSQGIEAQPPKYRWDNKIVNAGYVTTFNDYAVVSENRVTPVPSHLSFEIASLLADTITTGFGLINNDAKVKIGESVVIFGAGGIGLGAILGARLAGAYPIVVLDLFGHKLDRAKEYGATHTLLGDEIGLKEKIFDIVGNQGADVVIDGTGSPKVIELCYSLTQSKGRCVLFGVMSYDQRVSVHTLPLHFGKVLTGSEGGSSEPHLDIPRYVRMMEQGVFDPGGFVSHRCQLEETNDAIQKMREGEVVHAIIHFD